ncbi:hypothetical protein QR680_007733 [Steinernema hermaphroditum]|uniref:Uncharacterized protein n=1 Tax=Steinernema hermaphroditum TaxID=289476 RepID=A0AA39M6L3_9BILA|nr:hypothetical protein QR680_007733 [Steinernema hermaphroditum]
MIGSWISTTSYGSSRPTGFSFYDSFLPVFNSDTVILHIRDPYLGFQGHNPTPNDMIHYWNLYHFLLVVQQECRNIRRIYIESKFCVMVCPYLWGMIGQLFNRNVVRTIVTKDLHDRRLLVTLEKTGTQGLTKEHHEFILGRGLDIFARPRLLGALQTMTTNVNRAAAQQRSLRLMEFTVDHVKHGV